ncbi:MAG: CBS domain-containing protein [Candidatus Omnitrophica bacterium]|nr:CBS domain-containing protein [Candidatus Omnitrophota bacterium]MCG2707513.1 CBS domain-containing protein [Candidatus Omnitrophota bacterium]
MQVKEIMSKEVITVRRSTKLKELLRLFNKFHLFPLVPVVEESNRLIGVVSFRSLIGVFSPYRPEILKGVSFLDDQEEDIFKLELTDDIGDLVIAEDIMETKFVSLQEDTILEEAFRLMKLQLKEEFPVVGKAGELVGKIGIFDIIRQVFSEKGVV